MEQVDFREAYYIQLGENGVWRRSSIGEGKLRIGWRKQNLEDINSARWSVIKAQLRVEIRDKGAVTRDLRALQNICQSTDEDIWIAYWEAKLWWCRVGESRIYEDGISKYRKVKGQWYDQNVYGETLTMDVIPDSLLQLYRHFRATACKVHSRDDLWHLINDSVQ